MKALAGMVVVGSALLASCSKKPLQTPDGGGSGGIGLLDGGQGFADAGPIDAPPLFAGIRSFVVTSQLRGADGGMFSPSSHAFTMVVDADQHMAIFGTAGLAQAARFALEASGWQRVVGALALGVDGALCPASSITYSELRFAIDDGGRLTGSGSGNTVVVSNDVGELVSVTMSLSGLPDTQGPTLTVAGASTDPFGAFSVVASEPLAAPADLALRSADGETIELPVSGGSDRFVFAFLKPPNVLRYATQYQLITSGIADFAGNPVVSSAGLVFTTLPRPPLAAEDGFESLDVGTTFGGAKVLSGSGEPTIAGAKSLYVPFYNPVNTAIPVPLALRLQVGAGDTVVRFSYRTVNGNGANVGYYLGSEGRTINTRSTEIEQPSLTPGTIAGSQVMLGPLRTASFPLPPDVLDEVVLERTVFAWYGCGPPPPIVGGIIIDDLRVE